MSEKEVFKLLLLGRTGNGKSTTGNTIAGQKLFRACAAFGGVTSRCSRKVVSRADSMLEILDCPGLFDPNKSLEEIGLLIIQAVGGMYDDIHPGPHAILYVVRIGRYTAEEHAAYTRLKALFDNNITNHMIVLFTHGDDLEEEETTIDDMIHDKDTPETLREVIRECNNRYVVFNNKAVDKQPQVEELLSMIRQMVAQNSGQTYTCSRWNEIGEAMKEQLIRRLRELEKEELRGNEFVQELEIRTMEAEERVRLVEERRHNEMDKLKNEVIENPSVLCNVLKSVLTILAGIVGIVLSIFL